MACLKQKFTLQLKNKVNKVNIKNGLFKRNFTLFYFISVFLFYIKDVKKSLLFLKFLLKLGCNNK